MKFEIEEEAGGYVRNGDVLEWVWKDPPKDEPAPKKEQAKKGKA